MQEGGWYALELKATADLAQKNLKSWGNVQEHMSSNTTTSMELVQSLAADPKGVLLEILRQKKEISKEQLGALIVLLRSQGNGFDSQLVSGDWVLLMKQQLEQQTKWPKWFTGRRSRKFGDRRFVKETSLGPFAMFSDVKFQPLSQKFNVVNKLIVLRQIACYVVRSGLRFFKWRIPLFKREENYTLHWDYLDRDLTVTTDDAGDIYVHGRPSLVDSIGA